MVSSKNGIAAGLAPARKANFMRLEIVSNVRDGNRVIIDATFVIEENDGLSGAEAEQLIGDSFQEAQSKLKAKMEAAIASMQGDPALMKISRQLGVSPLTLAKYGS